MRKRDSSDSESSDGHESSGSEDNGSSGGRTTPVEKGVSEYEKQRLSRIAENRARMEALGLPQMASSLMGSSRNSTTLRKKRKGKAKVAEDDDDYSPEEEVGPTSSSEDEKYDLDDDDDDYLGGKASGSSKRKTASKKVKNAVPKSKKKVTVTKISPTSDYIDDDDDALKMAIALSLQDSGPSRSTDMVNANANETKGKMQANEDTWNKKRKKSFASRLQMTEDELILHFYQFDENWNDGITVRDLERVATAHDFTWTDKELSDMIRCFDSDGDGKLSLEDFRKIAVRCHIIKGCDGP